jgi:hypothetical protein
VRKNRLQSQSPNLETTAQTPSALPRFSSGRLLRRRLVALEFLDIPRSLLSRRGRPSSRGKSVLRNFCVSHYRIASEPCGGRIDPTDAPRALEGGLDARLKRAILRPRTMRKWENIKVIFTANIGG